ncbi:RNA polymerase sigma factor SigW [Peribacillus sp. SCS-37]|uniref:RNA polymerase sigma factor SigW n=1 Tax=Paraperibacillus esterisolvens TaxID=3115296 RepID=UPI003906420D
MEVLVKEKINQVLNGDQNAYSTIVEEYKDKVFYLCYRMVGNRHEAEDLAQEAFVKAYIHLKSFNMNLKFSTWIYRIATNLCIDRIRKKKPDYYLDAEIAGTDGLDMYSQLASDADSPEKEAESMEMQEAVQKEILKLPEKYRSVIILKYMEDLSLKEISDALDLPVGTVKTRIHRGREALRLQLRHL